MQNILEGRNKRSKPKNTRNENLPLRGFLACNKCGGKLTGSASKSSSGNRYYYYHCRKGCKERFRADKFNEVFLDYLKSFQVPNEILALYYAIMKDLFQKDDAERDDAIQQKTRKINHIKELLNSVEDKFFSNQIDDKTYHRARNRYELELTELDSQKLDLELQTSNFMKYVEYGFSLLKDLDKYYQNASLEVKQKIISSIFPEKIIFDGEKCRTSEINKALALIISNIDTYGNVKQEKAVKNDDLSGWVPPVGVEPTHPAPEAGALSTELRGQL